MTEDRDIRESQGTGTKMRERSATQEAILRAKLEWERTFDSVPDLIAIFDRNHRIVRLNRAMAERSGRPPAACIGPACYESVHCRAAPIKDCPHVFTLLDGQDHTAEVHEEQFGGDFMVTTSPLKDLDGQIVGSVHIARDITEQKRVEQREQEALATVTASRTAVDILGAMVSRNGNCQEFYEVELPQFSSAGRRKGRRPLVETPLSRLVSASGYSGVDRSILGGETPSNAPRSGDRVRTCSLFRIRRCSMKSMKTENRWTRTATQPSRCACYGGQARTEYDPTSPTNVAKGYVGQEATSDRGEIVQSSIAIVADRNRTVM